MITISKDNKPVYNIYLEKDFSEFYHILKECEIKNSKVCIVTETTVGKLYCDDIIQIVKDYAAHVETFTFTAGEESKNLETVNDLYLQLIQSKFDRNDILIALGGGVVGDLTGYAASTYLRGIRFIQVPTSLLSMVDSSIGGKTGVDYKGYKNMIGAFYQPSAVYMNLSVLKTLTDEQYLSGYGEVIKYGLIKDFAFYQFCIEHKDQLLKRNLTELNQLVEISCNTKKLYVESDPTEKGSRAILNFGHTIGHAIEKLMNFTMLHGECVSVGMVAASYISYKRGYIKKEDLLQIEELLSSYHQPIRIQNLNAANIIAATKNDKKMKSGQIKFILLHEIGNAYIDDTVTDDEMLASVQYLLS